DLSAARTSRLRWHGRREEILRFAQDDGWGGARRRRPLQAPSMTSATAIARLPGRWMVLWMLVVVRVAMGYQFQAAASAAPWLIADFGIDYTTVGSLVGFYTLPGILFALPGGYIARRVGEKNLLLFGLALMTAGGAVSSVGGDFAWVMAGRLI